MTVQNLVDVPTLRTRIVAGESGRDAEILWAHSCEVDRPWEWLGPGDLLMTTGRNFPADPVEQVAFVDALVSAGCPGVALAEGMGAAPVSERAAQLADERGFAILETAFEIPFIALARTVAASSQNETQARLTRVLRIYDTYRVAVQGGSAADALLDRLSVAIGHELHVVDVTSGLSVLSTGAGLDGEQRSAVCRSVGDVNASPAITRMKHGHRELMLLPLGTHRSWVLVADVTGVAFDLMVLQHVNTIVTIEAERRRAESEARLSVSGRLLAHLAEGNVDSELVKDRLADFDLSTGPWQVLSVRCEPPVLPMVVQGRLADADVPHLVQLRGSDLLVLTIVDGPAVNVLRDLVGTGRIGVSGDVTRISRVADGIREADWAREAGQADGEPVAHYGQGRAMFLPGTLAEAEAVVAAVLGPLIDYDDQHGTDLVRTVDVFFTNNRSWQSASRALQIHKQTLVYRMKRVGEVTGRRMDDIDDIVEMHLALRTMRLLQRS